MKQLELCWLEKEANQTVRTMSCAQMVTLVTNARCCDHDRAHAISACDLHAKSIAVNERRDRHPGTCLMGCMDCCESMAAEIACTASSCNGYAHQSDLQCWI